MQRRCRHGFHGVEAGKGLGSAAKRHGICKLKQGQHHCSGPHDADVWHTGSVESFGPKWAASGTVTAKSLAPRELKKSLPSMPVEWQPQLTPNRSEFHSYPGGSARKVSHVTWIPLEFT